MSQMDTVKGVLPYFSLQYFGSLPLVLRPISYAIYFGNLINYSMRQLPVYCFSKRNLQELKELNSVNFQHFSFLMVHPRS